jgi:hypothetical protein
MSRRGGVGGLNRIGRLLRSVGLRAVGAACIVAVAVPLAAFASDELTSVSPGRNGTGSGDDPGLKRATQEKIEREARAREERQSAAERERRVASRTAYEDRTPSEARALARDTFPQLSVPPLGRLMPGETIERYLSEHSAVVDDGHGEKLLLESSVPVATRDGDGHLGAVDLSLDTAGSGWIPRNPLAHARLGKDGSVELLDSGVSLRLEGARPGGDAETLSANKAFVPDVLQDQDVDVITAATVRGAELSFLLRSARSPESFVLDVGFPSGTELDAAHDPEHGGAAAAAIRRGDARVAAISAPTAVDADGHPVPPSLRIAGDQLVVRVAHRAEDVRYPIYVDPEIIENFNFQQGSDNTGWMTQYSSQYGCFNFSFTTSFWGRGFYTTNCASTSGVWFWDQEWGEWRWQAPRATAIRRAEELNLYHTYTQLTCLRGYIWDRNAGVTSAYQIRCADVSSGYYDLIDGNPAAHRGNFAVHNMMITQQGLRYNFDYSFMGWAKLYVEDFESPSITSLSAGLADGLWHQEGVAANASVQARDPGLGVKTIVAERAGSAFDTRTNGCSGYRGSCPEYWTQTFSYNTSSISEGTNAFSTHATDVVGQSSARSYWYVKVDRSAPTINISGALPGLSGKWMSGNAAVSISASDSYSGVKSVETFVDGTSVDLLNNACTTAGCPNTQSRAWTMDSTQYSPGPHTISVVAKDPLGHSTTSSWTVKVDNTLPFVDVEGMLWDAENEVLYDGTTYDLSVDAADGDSSDPESGVKSIEILVDGVRADYATQSCSVDNCEMQRSWTFNPANYSEGDHGIDVVVTDQAGNWDDESAVNVTVRHSQAAHSAAASADASGAATGASAGEQAGASAKSIGDFNGDGIDDYAVGAPYADNPGRVDSGVVYVINGAAVGSSLDLSSPGVAAYRIVGAATADHAGAAVAPAGDVNGDGFGDILVGAPRAGITLDPSASNVTGPLGKPVLQGSVYVIFGRPFDPGIFGSSIDLATLGPDGFRIDGPAQRGDSFGDELSGPVASDFHTRADFNGDAFDDIVIGSPHEGGAGRFESGAAYVVFGKTSTTTVDVSALGTLGLRIAGAAAGNHAGAAAAPAGDVDNDGYADVAIAAPDASPSGLTGTGTVYVVRGAPSPTSLDLGTMTGEGNRIYGTSGDALGSSLASLGDVNGDDYDDFAIGGSGAYVVYGGDFSAVPTLDLSQPLSQPLMSYRITPATTDLGTTVVGSAGDIDGDNVGDVLVGFPNASAPFVAQGSLYVVFGQATFSTPTAVDLGQLGGHRGTRFLGDQAGDRLGTSADGLLYASTDEPGILAGAPGADGSLRPDAGRLFVMRSSSASSGYKASAASSSSTSSHGCAPRGQAPTSSRPQGTAPYAFTRPADLAHCRRTGKQVADVMPKGRYASARKPVKRLAQNSAYSGARKWPLVNSFGNTIAYVEQLRLHQFRVRTAADVEYGTTPNGGASGPTVKIQGRACMSPDNLEDSYALIYLQGAGSSKSPSGSTVDAGIRAFISRNALVGSFKSGSTRAGVDKVVDNHAVGCGASRYDNEGRLAIDSSVPKPTFSGDTDRFQGPSLERSCPRRGVSRWSPNCGYRYEDYSRPSVNADAMLFSRATTGVASGGIANGVIQASRAFRELDRIRYLDHSVPCGRELMAHWYFGDANPNAPYTTHRDSTWRTKQQHVYGWYPHREPTGKFRNSSDNPPDAIHC